MLNGNNLISFSCAMTFFPRTTLNKCIHAFQPMETDNVTAFRMRSGKAAQLPCLPEVEVYLHLLVLVYLIDNKDHSQVRC